MRKVAITQANDIHHGKTMVSLQCEKDYKLIGKMESLRSLNRSQSQGFWYITESGLKQQGAFTLVWGMVSSTTTKIYKLSSKKEIGRAHV